MTVQEAKDILAKDSAKENLKYENKYDVFIGDLVKETFDDDIGFPNGYIINVAAVDKGKQPKKDDWIEWFVSKIDGHCELAEPFESAFF
jgi:hypothetical protein